MTAGGVIGANAAANAGAVAGSSAEGLQITDLQKQIENLMKRLRGQEEEKEKKKPPPPPTWKSDPIPKTTFQTHLIGGNEKLYKHKLNPTANRFAYHEDW